jgi:hypothetical protein
MKEQSKLIKILYYLWSLNWFKKKKMENKTPFMWIEKVKWDAMSKFLNGELEHE